MDTNPSSSKPATALHARLRRLHEVRTILFAAQSCDDLCRRAVDLGCTRLGFERLSIWFADSPTEARGSYGTDEVGRVRDERAARVAITPTSPMGRILRRETSLLVEPQDTLLDHTGAGVGQGMHAIAALEDGHQILGCVSIDNHLTQTPLTDDDYELLRLYASTLGHLYLQLQTNAARHEAIDELTRFIDLAADLLCTISPDGFFQMLNPVWETTLGFTNEELRAHPIIDFVHPDDREATVELMTHLQAGQRMSRFVNRYRCRTGDFCWLEWEVVATADCRLYATARDITARKQAEAALCEVTQRLQLATASARLGIWEWDITTDSLIWNTRMFELYGLARADFTGRMNSWQQGLHPADAAATIEACRAAVRGEREFDPEYRIIQPDGTVKTLKANAVVLRDPHGTPRRMIGLNRDITEFKEAEEALRASEDRFQKAFQISPDAINITRLADGVYLEMNEGFTRLTGYTADEVLGRSSVPEDLHIWVQDEDRQRLLAGLHAAGEVIGLEAPFRGKDGSILIGLMSARLIELNGDECVLSFTRDITARIHAEEERDRLQAQLAQAQKMESIGRLAGGVAHDFNNMLGVILGNTELAMLKTTPAHPLHSDLVEIKKAAERSAALTRQLLAFARKQTVAPKVLDLNDTIAGMFKMLRRLIGEDIDLLWHPCPALWPVHLDPTQVDQILANLCVNARDAIADGGKVIIATNNLLCQAPDPTRHPGVAPGAYVQLVVTDTGCGMDVDTHFHLFEPFFTTKGVGEGTGLGLATVYGVVKQNHGFINVATAPGQGTTFTIYLPRHNDPIVQLPDNSPVAVSRRGQETVLLVEDEPAILKLSQRILSQQGYCVLAATTPGEALHRAETYTDIIHLLMTDVVMPDMNGRDLARHLLARHPEMKCLFISGYTADVIAPHGVLDKGVHFLPKPFSLHELAAKVREVLDQ
jgi:two-component system cell cycle sensor histidine kinase/response regulator CckA